jgi:hypothetical protein
MRSVGVALAFLAASCATGAPIDKPNTFTPKIKPSPSKLVFNGSESCDLLKEQYNSTLREEGGIAHQAAIMDYERGLMFFLSVGTNLVTLDRLAKTLAEKRGDMVAIRDRMEERSCADIPELVFTNPAARDNTGNSTFG